MVNEGNQVGGLKAALHNDRVTEEGKERVVDKLEQLGYSVDGEGNVEKASGSTNKHSSAGDDEDEVVADADDADYAKSRSNGSGDSEDTKHQNHVIGGHKATLHNPKSTEEAKETARNYLREHNVEFEE